VRAGGLNSGSESDNAKEIFDRYKDFEVELVRQAWGVKLEMKNAPGQAFVDGEMIRGIKEHVFAVLRDVIFISNEIIEAAGSTSRTRRPSRTPVFHILRNARVLDFKSKPNLVVCWGGIRSTPRNTSTPRRWATSSACAAWTCARAAARAP
jgi:hypothetical protein